MTELTIRAGRCYLPDGRELRERFIESYPLDAQRVAAANPHSRLVSYDPDTGNGVVEIEFDKAHQAV